MGNFASRVHSKEDGKVYNILPLGDMPTVVFGRVIKPNSVPGMQYYFSDGRVKYKVNTEGGYGGWEMTIPFIDEEHTGGAGNPRQLPCIFTVPEDLDFSRMGDVEYVRQFCRTAGNLNANTMSPNFIIRNGKIICVKQIDFGSNKILSLNEDGDGLSNEVYKSSFVYRFVKKMSHSRVSVSNINNYKIVCKWKLEHCIHNEFTIIPVVTRSSHKTSKIYKSLYNYSAYRYGCQRGGVSFNFWKWSLSRFKRQKDIFTQEERVKIFEMMKEEFNKSIIK